MDNTSILLDLGLARPRPFIQFDGKSRAHSKMPPQHTLALRVMTEAISAAERSRPH